MTTKLESIRTAVTAHFAAMETYKGMVQNHLYLGGAPYEDKNFTGDDPHHIAFCHLRDLLPLLEAAIEWDGISGDTEFDESVTICDNLSNEVAALRKETS